MRLLRGRIAPGSFPGGSVVTIGKFDGLHLGHRAVLAAAARVGSERRLPVVMLSFEPLPVEFFAGRAAPARLARFVTKWRLVAETGVVKAFACLRFDAALAAQDAEEFVHSTLVSGLSARAIVVGEAFRFGRERRGDVETLRRLGARRGFDVTALAPVRDAAGRISSSRVRNAVAGHDFAGAAELLGQAYRLFGRVVAGERLGRRLGFATANLALGRRAPPLGGIYVVRARRPDGWARYGMASVGERPTVNGRRRLLEVHFPGFAGNLYGSVLAVDFLHWLRAEAKFAGLDELAAAVRDDVAQGARWLAGRGEDWGAAVPHG